MDIANDYMFKNFLLHTPYTLHDIIDCRKTHMLELIVTLRNGVHVLYDDTNNSIRQLPLDSNAMTEEECRFEFGDRLRRIMLFKGVTQDELSELTGIRQYLISNYMNGKTSPGLYNLDKIAKALNCSLDEFRYI